MDDVAFYTARCEYPRKRCIYTEVMYLQCCSVVTWPRPREAAAISTHVPYTPYNHAPLYSILLLGTTIVGCVCFAVTCPLHFWQNDRGLLRAPAVSSGWNGYRNRSQHRKLTLEKKSLPTLLPGLEPATFRSWVRRCITELSPLLLNNYHMHIQLSSAHYCN